MNMFEWTLYVQLEDSALLFIYTQTIEILYISLMFQPDLFELSDKT